MLTRPLLLALLLTGCRNKDSADLDTGALVDEDPVVDADADGYTADEDCDDANSVVHPGAEEICDGVDNNCDGTIDEGVTTTFYADDDGDGFGDAGSAAESCDAPDGYVAIGSDCDDGDPEVYPGYSEQCDGVDNDCDGETDEDVRYDWYADADGDGFGDPGSAFDTCDPPPGYVTDSTDCDDTEASAFPGGVEVCDEADNDCDGTVDEDVTTTFYQDTDGDSFGVSDQTTEACSTPTGYATRAGDCDDADGAISPNAAEVCDDIDNDCDGDADADAIDQETWYADGDGDGYGGTSSTTDCDQPSGHTSNSADCDDSDAAVNPAATEVCDGVDNDCDGDIDTDATDQETWYADGDGDGYGSTSSTTACEQPSGYADNADDCDDGDASASPGEAEVCDEVDNDCDGDTDEDLTTTFYLDADADGYGDPDSSVDACSAPSTKSPAWVTDSTDCDDLSASSNPGASEVCDGEDNDCDAVIDNGVLGSGASCAAESCAEILDEDSTASDGDYWLDPDGSGATEYTCDMGTDGGGWTQVLIWNREDDGDTQSDFEALMTENINSMGDWTESSSYIQWSDYDATGDVLDYELDVIVPNDGEVLFVIDYYGASMEQSGMWFYVTAGGSEQNLKCAEASTTIASNCFTGSYSGLYSTADQSYLPTYTCSSEASGNLSWDETGQHDFSGDEVTSFHLTSMMCDASYGDYSRLYDLEVWIR